MNLEAFRKDCLSIGINLSDQQLKAFEQFEEALYEWNEKKNLTRIPREECAAKHFLDSLLVGSVIRDHCPVVDEVLDIGSGPGFPAWPIACAFPGWQITAIDSNGKMLDFLRSQPLPNLKVVQERVEDWNRFETFDVVTGRAVAPLAVQLEISLPLVKKYGWIIPMRTPKDVFPTDEILEKHGLAEQGTEKLPLGKLEIERIFPIYMKLKRFDKRKKRTWAEIKKKPWF